MLLWTAFSDQWSLGQIVTFDGDSRTIYVSGDATNLSIRTDVYSSWKEWTLLYDNAKFLPAIRTTGGDPIGGGQYTGDVYFLINGWKLRVDVRVTSVEGVLFSDDYSTAYYDLQTGDPIYPAKVSSIVNTISVNGSTSSLTAADIWAYNNRQLTQSIPSAIQIRQEIDANSTKLASIKAKTDTITPSPTSSAIASAVRTELTPELSHITTLQNGQGLSSAQATMLMEIYRLYGLDPTQPLIVTTHSRSAGDAIQQNITTSPTQTTITRV